MLQKEIENSYSRKIIRSKIKGDIDITSDVFKNSIKNVQDYMLKQYYLAKDKRIAELHFRSITVEEIVLELFASILPYQKMVPIQSVAANLGSRLGYKHILDSIKTASEIIAVCENSGLYTIYHTSHVDNDTDTLGIRAHYRLSDEVVQYINETMFLPPMIEQPKPWKSKDNTGGGYIQDTGSCILGSLNHHNLQQNLQHLNTLQEIPWELNHHMLLQAEIPNKLLETDEQLAQFETFRKEAIEIRKLMLNSGNRFYFRWDYDKRGRSYSKGYHINLQATEYQKAVLQFAEKEILIC